MTEHLQKRRSRREGDILVSVIVFAAIAITITLGLVNWGAALIREIRTVATREQAFQIAEAGIDYYRWHLAQYPTDYQDGTGVPGPYVHDFYDKNGVLLGTYSLSITPPPVGSTKVIVTSTASTTADPSIVKMVQAVLAKPSLAQYSVVANDNLRFGSGTSVYGPVTANGGIRFDGTAYNTISSAQRTYTDPDTGLTEWGVWTSETPADPQPPTAEPSRPDVFTAGRDFPVPASDFTGLTVNLQQLQTTASGEGYDFPKSQYTYTNNRGKLVTTNGYGYLMVLNTDGTFTMYVVTALVSPPNGCSNYGNQAQWGTWSIKTDVLYKTAANQTGVYALPPSGVVFAEDNLWVQGQVNGARLTIAAGILPDPGPSGEPSITINNDLLYTNTDGTDVLGLIAQGNVNVGLVSANNLTIDGALVSENGRVGRYYYYPYYCDIGGVDYVDRSSITLDGMIATDQRYGFAYTDNTGYSARNIYYDNNLLYGPPPSFPLASTQYQLISWRQLQ
ncbi:MAG: hypothetical protein KGI69_00200 [Patescibacteria group bacterium]|nr:hypothetical protein [Patescibacteria group bacterium]